MASQNLPVSLPLPAALTEGGRGAATATILALLFSYFLISLLKKRRMSARLPPGPYAWPIIGNLHQLVLPAHRSLKALAELHLQDFVDVLLHLAQTDAKITREIIKALVLDMFGAGLETTATTLEWAMSELLRHGKVKESDLATMKYLHCVVKETLRLYPAVPLAIPHESLEAVTVGGYYIPKKTTVLVNLWAIGRDPNVWGADASKFKPERFMEDEHINLTEQSDFSMIPFSAGRRGCPGVSMAIPTIELAVAQLLHTFDWKVEGDPSQLDMKEACGVTIPREAPLCAYPSLRVNFPL